MPSMNRRSMILAGAGLAMPAIGARAQALENTLVVRTTGGVFEAALKRHFFDPFTRATGTRIVPVATSYGEMITKTVAMHKANAVEWDIISPQIFELENLSEYLLDLGDCSAMPNVASQGVPGACVRWGVHYLTGGNVLTWNTETLRDKAPRSWADFWDVQKFPGERALLGQPQSVLEAALMADGVPHEDVYKVLDTKEGQDRAFNKIRELKPHVALWWTGGSQPVQAIGSGEVVMANGWNGRLQAGITEGVPLKIVWNGAIDEVGYFMMVKGAPHKEEATELLRWIAKPESQAEFYKYVSYGPTMPGAWDFIPKSEWGRLPSSPDIMKQSIFLNVDWWLKNEGAMTERYNALMQE